MLVEIREKSFNAYQEIESFENNLDIKGEYGATASFIGSMRDFNEGREVTSMFLEYYPEMTEKQLRELGLCWDQLIMNVGNGARVLINDKITRWLPDRAISVNVETDKGFEVIDWEEIGV